MRVPIQQDPEALAKSRLRDGAEHVTMGQSENNLVYANSGGHGVLQRLEQMERKIMVLESKDEQKSSQIKEHQKDIDEFKKNISFLECRVRQLGQTSEGYLSIRRRFIDVYKRDVKGMEEFKGSKAIYEGNIKAHNGDALVDAVLFDRDQRTDKSIYRELYGIESQQVLDYRM